MSYNPTFASDFGIKKTLNLFAQIRNDVVLRNESWDIFIAQKRGAGKSTVAISLARLLDPHFTLDHVCFTVDKFIGLLTSRLPPGTVLVFDDLGTQEGGSSRRWQKKEAHDLADIMQLNRTDGLITIATSLELERGEKRLRAGFGLLADPGNKLSDEDTRGHGLASRIILRKKRTDVFDGTTRWQYWRYATGGRIVAIDISHPPAALWRDYIAMRTEFLQRVKKMHKDEEAKQTTTKGIKIAEKEYVAALHTRSADIAKYREVLKWMYDQGAVSKDTAIPHEEVRAKVAEVFLIDHRTGVTRVIQKWYGAEFARYWKQPRGGAKIWLLERGIKFVLREPL